MQVYFFERFGGSFLNGLQEALSKGKEGDVSKLTSFVGDVLDKPKANTESTDAYASRLITVLEGGGKKNRT